MANVTRNGATLFYEDLGSGDPTIVLVHGIGNHAHFQAQIEHFSLRRRVIAPDLPGFGRSEAPDRDYGLEAYAEDVAWLCQELGVRHAAIVGHSMGGAVAVEVAARHPELACAVVLLDPIPIVANAGWRDAMGPFVEVLRGPGYRQALQGFAEARMFRPTDDPELRERIVDDMISSPQHVVAATLASILGWQGDAVVRRVEVPMLLVSAGDGMPADLVRTREIMPTLELGRTVGSGHFAHVFVPQQVNAMIERFLEVSVPTPATA